MKPITLKHKFYISLVLLAAAFLTTLPYFTGIVSGLILNGGTFLVLCAPAILLFAAKMKKLHTQTESEVPYLFKEVYEHDNI